MPGDVFGHPAQLSLFSFSCSWLVSRLGGPFLPLDARLAEGDLRTAQETQVNMDSVVQWLPVSLFFWWLPH